MRAREHKEVTPREAHVLLVGACSQGGRVGLTTVKNVSQRRLLAAIMLPLLLVFYSLTDDQARGVDIPCGQDIDATINADPKATATRFVLGACNYTASETVKTGQGD